MKPVKITYRLKTHFRKSSQDIIRKLKKAGFGGFAVSSSKGSGVMRLLEPHSSHHAASKAARGRCRVSENEEPAPFFTKRTGPDNEAPIYYIPWCVSVPCLLNSCGRIRHEKDGALRKCRTEREPLQPQTPKPLNPETCSPSYTLNPQTLCSTPFGLALKLLA